MQSKVIERWALASKQDSKVFVGTTKSVQWNGRKKDAYGGFICEGKGEFVETYEKWSDSTIKKFLSINTNNNTCKGILKQFNQNTYKTYKSYNPQFPNWEYLCLLKLVWDGLLKVDTTGKKLTFCKV